MSTIREPVVTFLSDCSGAAPETIMTMMLAAMEFDQARDPSGAVLRLMTKAYRIPNDFMTWSDYRASVLHGTHYIDSATSVGKIVLSDPGRMADLNDLLQGQVTHTNICKMARRYDYPFWLVGRELCDMLAKTDSLADPNVNTEARLPFRGLHFLLPKGAVTLPDGDTLTMIGVADLTLEDVQEQGFATPPGLEHGDRRCYIAGHTASGACYFSRLPVSPDGVVADPSTQEFTLYGTDYQPLGDPQDKEEGAACANVVAGWALKLLIVMNAEPALNEVEIVTGHRKPKKDKRPMTFLDPRWLGRKIVNGVPVHSQGHHSSPHTHWRRGHMARRRCGKGRTETRVVYIKPVLVNGPETQQTGT